MRRRNRRWSFDFCGVSHVYGVRCLIGMYSSMDPAILEMDAMKIGVGRE